MTDKNYVDLVLERTLEHMAMLAVYILRYLDEQEEKEKEQRDE